MQGQKVHMAFERKGYLPNAYIDRHEYNKLLNMLMLNGKNFEQQVADQIWMQASGNRPSREIKVSEICNTFIQAHQILRGKLQETKIQIQEKQAQKRKLQATNSRNSIQRLTEIEYKLEELYEEKNSFEESLKLVTEPFGIHNISHFNDRSFISTANPQQINEGYAQNNIEYQTMKTDGSQNQSEQLKIMFYLILIFGFIEVIIIFGKYDFLNLIVLTCLLSIYLMNFFDPTYIKLTFVLTTLSICLDIVWLVIYAGPKWNPSEVSNNSEYQLAYMRFIIFFTIILAPIKIAQSFFLFRLRKLNGLQKTQISLGIIKMNVGNSQPDPISKSLAGNQALSF